MDGCHKTNFVTRPTSRAMPPLQEMQDVKPLPYQAVRHFPPVSSTLLHPTKNLTGRRKEVSMIDHDAALEETEEAYNRLLEGQLRHCEAGRRPSSAPVRSRSTARTRCYGPGQTTFKKSAHLLGGNVSRKGGYHQHHGIGDGVVFGSEVLVQWLEKNASQRIGQMAASTY